MALTIALKAILAVLLIFLIVSATACILYYTERKRQRRLPKHQEFRGIDPVLDLDGADPYALVSHMHACNLGPYPRTGTLIHAHPQHLAPAHVHHGRARGASAAAPPPPPYSKRHLTAPHFSFNMTRQTRDEPRDLAHAHYQIDNAAGRDPQLRARSNTNPETQFVLLPPPPPRSAKAKRTKRGFSGDGPIDGASRDGRRRDEYVDIELGRA